MLNVIVVLWGEPKNENDVIAPIIWYPLETKLGLTYLTTSRKGMDYVWRVSGDEAYGDALSQNQAAGNPYQTNLASHDEGDWPP